MKEEVKVSLVQFASEWLELEKNIERMRSFVETEAKEGAELIVFPELANIGYITPLMVGEPVGFKGMSNTEFASRYVRAAEPIPGPTTEALSELTRKYGVYITVGLAQRHPVIPGTLCNAAVLLGPKGVIGLYHKMHLFVNEKQYFYPGNTSGVFKTELANIGLEICYDCRFPELSRILALKGAEVICCLFAGPASFGGSFVSDPNNLKYRSYTRAQENLLYFISCNRAGQQDGVEFGGRSAIAAPNGTIMASSETSDEDVIRARFTEEQLINCRSTVSCFRDRRPEMYGVICEPLLEPLERGIIAASEAEVTSGSTASKESPPP